MQYQKPTMPSGTAPESTYQFPEDHLFTLPNGRGTLSYMIFGDPSAPSDRTVFYNHGTGSSLLDAYLYDAAARKRRIRVVGIDRPGSGNSSLPASHASTPRRVSDWPADVLALAAHLGADRFAMIGVSGGGPYTYACVDAIPPAKGLISACVLASAYPPYFGTAGMSMANRFLFWICAWSPWVVEKIFDITVGSAVRNEENPEEMVAMMDKGFGKYGGRPAPDREVWHHGARGNSGDEEQIEAPVLRAVMAESVRRSLRHGSKGAAWDLYAVAADWGFKIEDLAGKVQGLEGQDTHKTKLVVFHGTKDVNCPISMALKAKALLPDADWRISEQDAHVSTMVNTAIEVMDAVDRMFSR